MIPRKSVFASHKSKNELHFYIKLLYLTTVNIQTILINLSIHQNILSDLLITDY
jgi:hypothetical protein